MFNFKILRDVKNLLMYYNSLNSHDLNEKKIEKELAYCNNLKGIMENIDKKSFLDCNITHS